MSQRYKKLNDLLLELFQLDQPDLDFGLYRIMHAKADEVTQFLDNDLLPQVKEAFKQYEDEGRAEVQVQLEKLEAQILEMGMDPNDSKKVKELKENYESGSVDINALENDVYDHLYSFFRRYYSEGDFLSKRVYKKGVYTIPYEGEKVLLHWANKDQYYIKTSEYLRNYTFRLRPKKEDNPMRMHFRLADATEGEHGNVKAADDKKRVFVLAPEDFISEEDGALVIRFKYRPATNADWTDEAKADATKAAAKSPPKQDFLRRIAVDRVLAAGTRNLQPWISELVREAPTEKNPNRTELERQLTRYFGRNTFDYFIHKDLGGFLRRELDFYIKNEVMHLDDIESDTAPRVEQYLSKIKVIRRIAGKIIDFLAQLEDFQKKLWLKKKFVTEASWCIRVGCIPDDFYEEICANDAQREEWIELLAIDEQEADLTTSGYTNPLTPGFLKGHPTLMVDTRHFSAGFTQRLLDAMGDVDEKTDGVLFHSENFQALSLMQARYREQVKCIYIDPPYNTSENTFVYKNAYKHSSWMAMIQGRIDSAKMLLRQDGVLQCAIDDTETSYLRIIMDTVFGKENRVTSIAVEVNPAGQNLRPNTPALSHDYCHVYAADVDRMEMLLRSLTKDEQSSYTEKDASGQFLWDNLRRRGGNSRPNDRPGQWYPLYVDRKTLRVSVDAVEGFEEVWPIDPKQISRIWRTNPAGSRRGIASGEISVIEKAGRLEVVKKSRMPSGKKPKTLWCDTKYSATTHGTKLLIAILGDQIFSYPKSIHLVVDCLRYWCDASALILDYFAGSGTTGHAVINLNREDGGQRKFILVEMGDYFDTVLLPRLKKVTFSPEWKDGKPKRLATEEEAERSPRIIKVVRLESYEDTLNNLAPKRTEEQQVVLELPEAQGANGLKEQYMLRYLLNVETRGSQSLLDVQAFADPTAYKLSVKTPGSDESREVAVDLLETFNYLVGLTVEHMAAPQAFTAEFERDEEKRLQVKGDLVEAEDPHPGPLPEGDGEKRFWFRPVSGTNPEGQDVLIIWRKLTGNSEEDNLVLNTWFEKQGYSSKDSKFDLIYLNGDNNLESLKKKNDTWRVHLIEEDFHRLMFEGTEATSL